MSKKQKQIQNMKNGIVNTINKFIEDEQRQMMNKMSNSKQISQNKLKNTSTIPVVFKGGDIYDQIFHILDKLKKIKKRMSSINKIKKQKLHIFNQKLLAFITELQNIVQAKSLTVKIDKNMVLLVQQTNKSLTEGDRILTSLQKQSNNFCCGRNDQTKYSFYKAIINIIGNGNVWGIIPKLSLIVQQKVQKIQTFIPIRIDKNYLQTLIQTQIQRYWPQKSQLIDLCQRPHVDSQININNKQSAVSSSSQSLVLQQKNKNSIAENYMKLQQILQLKENLSIECQIRQAHEKLLGIGRPQQVNSAIQIYQNIIRNKQNPNIASAYNILGKIYQEGVFTTVDRVKSEQYYKNSADLNNPQGLYKIGKYFEKGLILVQTKNKQKYREQQLHTAIDYYEKAAALNHLDAITDLGFIYQKGILRDSNVDINTRKQSEVSQSQISTLGDAKYYVQPNLNYAMQYYTKAKNLQFPRALNNLGVLLIRQNQNIQQKIKGSNQQKGFKYLKKAAHLNYLKAQLNIGKCYQFGTGVVKDDFKAIKYYEKGSLKGDVSCKIQFIKHCLGKNPSNLQNKDAQIAKMLQMIRQVLSLNPKQPDCLYFMGILYEKGQAVIKNSQMAFYYINESAKLKYLPAITKLGDYYYSGFFVKKDHKEALKLYQQSSSKGESQAMINISLMIDKGLAKPTSGSNNQAINQLHKAALQQNNPNAYLMAGLHNMNYLIKQDEINSKIKKSLQMGNPNTIDLIQKVRKSEYLGNKINQKSYNKQRMLFLSKSPDKTIKYNTNLNHVKSSSNLKTYRL